ncbi:MAG: glucose 1-dehydrogenase [Hyphomicrobiaceae bacterium]|nr:glucose 1-dehydrogenase [Hyphomicrobiaceae bacterium]
MVVIVTGATGGIGAQISRCLGMRGARLVLMDLEQETLDCLADSFPGDAKPQTRRLDICDEEAVDNAVRDVAKKHGRLDALVNAAGIYRVAPIAELSSADFLDTMAVNLTGPFFLTRAAARIMSEAGGGRIVHLASVSSLVSNPEYGAYATSKAALSQMIRVAARELAPKGVTVNAIGQAVTETPLTQKLLSDPERRADVLSQIPMGRLCEPEDIFAAVLFLLAPGGAFVTGQTLYIDGGRTLV